MLSDRDYFRSGNRRNYSINDGPIIKPLIFINVLVFLLCTVTDTVSEGPGLLSYIALRGQELMQGQIWRLATYMFAHGGFFHILFNMWGLFVFGMLVERTIGARHTLYIYLSSGLAGGLLWLAANFHSLNSVVGASGALYGVIVAAAILYPQAPMQLLFPPITLPYTFP